MQYRAALARVYESSQDYDDAREIYENAIEFSYENSLWPEYQSPVEETKDIDEILRDLNQKDNQVQIERKIEQAGENIDEIESSLNETENEIKQISENYREQALQFIGFFAAIVAVILGSVEIATNFTSFAEAGGLLLIFNGGLILSFSGLSTSLRYHRSAEWDWRSLVLPIVGIALMVIGFLVPYALT